MGTQPKRYRKKPVVIEAMEHTAMPDDCAAIVEWGGGAIEFNLDRSEFAISTLEGTMTAEPGDFIIRGVAGEFYPCKPDIFAATYEEAPSDADRPSASALTAADYEAQAERMLDKAHEASEADMALWRTAQAQVLATLALSKRLAETNHHLGARRA